MTLHPEILRKRIRNEIENARRRLRHTLELSDPEINDFPLIINVSMKDIPGPVWQGNDLAWVNNHEFTIVIDENYPYQKPIVSWKTPIFHPNICPPFEMYENRYGYVCTRLLSNWNFDSNIVDFIKGIESLLVTPNTESPLPTNTCTRATEYFNTHTFSLPQVTKKAPLIVGEKDEEKAQGSG